MDAVGGGVQNVIKAIKQETRCVLGGDGLSKNRMKTLEK